MWSAVNFVEIKGETWFNKRRRRRQLCYNSKLQWVYFYSSASQKNSLLYVSPGLICVASAFHINRPCKYPTLRPAWSGQLAIWWRNQNEFHGNPKATSSTKDERIFWLIKCHDFPFRHMLRKRGEADSEVDREKSDIVWNALELEHLFLMW